MQRFNCIEAFGFQAAQRQGDWRSLSQFVANAFQFFACGFVALRIGWVGVHDEIDFAAQVVYHHQFFGQHQKNVGRTDGVGFFRLLWGGQKLNSNGKPVFQAA